VTDFSAEISASIDAVRAVLAEGGALRDGVARQAPQM